jgi:tetratricopeptide (TPR) repeat protein
MHASDGDPGALAEVCTGQRRAAAAEMYATADPTRGPSAWRRSEAILADYAARWEIARAASCAAEVPSSDERELRLACLADRRDHVDALVQVLGEPDPAVVRHAVDAAHALPSIEACNRVDSLGRAPLERIATPQRAQVWRRIARASALRRAGRYADAAELATSLVDEAGTATHRAAALHLAAEVETDRQQYVRAQELAREAVHAAAEAGDARIEFGSWLLLLYGVGWGRGRADEALAYGEAARAALLRLGDDVQLHSELLGALAAVEHQRGRHLETIALAEQAIALRESDDEGAARSGPLWQILGIAQHRLDREEDALVSHDHALARITALLGPTHPDTAQTLASRAQVLKALGRIDEARAGYEDAIAALEGTFGAQHRALAIPLLNLGNLERAEGDPTRAALVHARYREIVAREFPPDHHEHGRAHVSLAEEQLAAGDADAALASAAAAVGIARRHFAEPHVRLSYALGIQGAALLQLGRAHDAVAAHEEALALARRVLAPDDHELAAYLLDLADALAAADRRGDARSLRQQAREHLRRIPTAASVVRPRARELLERADRVL